MLLANFFLSGRVADEVLASSTNGPLLADERTSRSCQDPYVVTHSSHLRFSCISFTLLYRAPISLRLQIGSRVTVLFLRPLIRGLTRGNTLSVVQPSRLISTIQYSTSLTYCVLSSLRDLKVLLPSDVTQAVGERCHPSTNRTKYS